MDESDGKHVGSSFYDVKRDQYFVDGEWRSRKLGEFFKDCKSLTFNFDVEKEMKWNIVALDDGTMRMKRRVKILMSIEEAEQAGEYEISEHLTSNLPLWEKD